MYGATGIVSATKLYGDGSDLTGINAGAILGSFFWNPETSNDWYH